VQFGELGGDGGGLAGLILSGEHAALHQAGQAAGEGVGVDGEGVTQRGEVARHVAGRIEPGDDPGHLAVDHQAQVADRVDDQDAVFAERRQVDVGRAANQHRGDSESWTELRVTSARSGFTTPWPAGFRSRR
jgi:hypothetical protein